MKFRDLTTLAGRAADATRFATGRRGLRYGVLPSLVHQAMLRRLDPWLVIDVGANRGQFSLDVARSAPAARVIAFEPLHEDAATYRRVFAGMPSHRLVELALGAVTGESVLHVAAARDSSSLLPIGELQVRFFPGTHEVATRRVPVARLDDVEDLDLDDHDRTLLKLDVQGGELAVLQGAGDTLDRVRWVYAEVSFVELYAAQPSAAELIAHLHRIGFDPVDVGRPTIVDGRAVQVDVLFERRDPVG